MSLKHSKASSQCKGSDQKKKQGEDENGKDAQEIIYFNPQVWLSYSKTGAVTSQLHKDDLVPVTDEHKRVIRATWGLMNGHLTESGTRIYLRIFEVNSRIKTVFGYVESDTMATMAKCSRLQAHAKRFMKAIKYAVENLDELGTLVSQVFVSLGKRHMDFKGLEPEHFAVFSGAMMWVWRHDLGEDFTPEVRAAWSRLFDYLLQHLRHGLELELDHS